MKMYLQFEGTLAEVDLGVNKDLCAEETSDSSEYDYDDVLFPEYFEDRCSIYLDYLDYLRLQHVLYDMI